MNFSKDLLFERKERFDFLSLGRSGNLYHDTISCRSRKFS